MENRRSIFFISDSTAITAHTLGKSLLTRFENVHFDQTILPFVNTIERARQAVVKINKAVKKDGRRDRRHYYSAGKAAAASLMPFILSELKGI